MSDTASILQRLGLEGVSVSHAANEEHYWINMTIHTAGGSDWTSQSLSKSIRCPFDPSDAQIDEIKQQFRDWEEEINRGRESP
ncbi:MAG: hypothetical protein AB7O43_18345 [Hyphomicrobiaceae bacterium]